VSGIQTATRSQTNSFTEARLRAVMPEVGADFTNMAGAAIISFATAQRWSEELTFVLQKQAARGFQVQLRCSSITATSEPGHGRVCRCRRRTSPSRASAREMRGARW
jgi:hypothetical protein